MNTTFKITDNKEENYRHMADEQGLTLIKLDGKVSYEPEWQKIEHRSYDEIGFRAQENAGIPCGKTNDLLVLDIDNLEAFEEARKENDWDIPETLTVRTGGGGLHYYFRCSKDGRDYRNRAFKDQGFDIRGEGGQVVAPGSVHPETGKTYLIESNSPITEAPGWLRELALREDMKNDAGELEDIDLDTLDISPTVLQNIREGVPKGKRSDAIWGCIMTLLSAGCTDGQIITVMEEYPIGEKYREKGSGRISWLTDQIDKGRLEVSTEVLSGDLGSALAKSEQGDADLFVKMYRGKFCYDSTEGEWFVFNGITWEPDRTRQTLNAVSGVAEKYLNEAKRLSGLKDGDHEKTIRALKERYGRLNSYLRMTHVLTLAGSGDKRSSLAISGDEWNSDPWILGCKNGVVDLRTGLLRKGAPEDYIRVITPVEWKGPDVEAPVWEGFMDTIFDGDRELTEYMQRLLGLSLIGQVREHVMPVLWGKGRNGKSTMFNTLKYILGEHASPIPAETLLKQSISKSGASHTADLFILKDRRLVWTSEISDGKYFDAAVVKRLTGGDDLSARMCHGRNFEVIKQTHTLMMLTNVKPHVHDANDYALFQRLHLIPFKLSFVGDPKEAHERQADVDLENKLKEEASGILAWLVRGCLKYLEVGLKAPEVILEATREYQSSEDVFGHFLEDCIEAAPNQRVSCGAVYKAYRGWSEDNGHYSLSATKFHKRMEEKFEKKKSGVYVYLDIALKAPPLPEEDDDDDF